MVSISNLMLNRVAILSCCETIYMHVNTHGNGPSFGQEVTIEVKIKVRRGTTCNICIRNTTSGVQGLGLQDCVHFFEFIGHHLHSYWYAYMRKQPLHHSLHHLYMVSKIKNCVDDNFPHA